MGTTVVIAISTKSLKGKALILIDWGNTLMHDDPTASGPMCDWPEVEAMPDAVEALRYMTVHFPVALATGASCSNRQQIVAALKRAGLDGYISEIFLASELGCGKSSPEFYTRVATLLGIAPKQLAMIGNDLVNDVLVARQAGVNSYWVPENMGGDSVISEDRFTLMEAAKEAVQVLLSEHREPPG